MAHLLSFCHGRKRTFSVKAEKAFISYLDQVINYIQDKVDRRHPVFLICWQDPDCYQERRPFWGNNCWFFRDRVSGFRGSATVPQYLLASCFVGSFYLLDNLSILSFVPASFFWFHFLSPTFSPKCYYIKFPGFPLFSVTVQTPVQAGWLANGHVIV